MTGIAAGGIVPPGIGLDYVMWNCFILVMGAIFDVMHIGHRAVLKKLSSYDNSVLIRFADNYSEIVYTEIEKEFVANSFEIKNMISLKSEIYENMPLSDFVKNYLVEKLNTDTVVVGENYDRMDELEKVCAANNIQVVKIPSVKKNEKEITTELVKTCLKNGDMNECIDLLGKTYVVYGTRVHLGDLCNS